MNTGSLAPLIKEFYPEYYSWNEYPVDNCVAIKGVKEQWGILGNRYRRIMRPIRY